MEVTITTAILMSILGAVINGIIVVAMMSANLSNLKERIGQVALTAERAHQRLDAHVTAHAEGKL